MSDRGSRFSYTYYTPDNASNPVHLKRASVIDGQPIHQSIEALDKEGMAHITCQPSKLAASSHDEFAAYLSRTKNTICGRHPIGVLLAALATLQEEKEEWKEAKLDFVRYEQSSACVRATDSSVSYASAVLTK